MLKFINDYLKDCPELDMYGERWRNHTYEEQKSLMKIIRRVVEGKVQ